MASGRPFTSWTLSPPVPPGQREVAFTEPLSRELAWKYLNLAATSPTHGRQFFRGTRAQQNALLREYRSYLHQAAAYDDAAQHVQGSSAGLLIYYAMLNLAKAELLRQNPQAIVGQTIRHGLNFSPTRARTVAADYLVVSNGVFPLLYQKRTGHTLTAGTRLPITRLLGHVPEIGWELGESGFADPMVAFMIHAAVCDDTHAWSLLALRASFDLTSWGCSAKTFNRSYELIDPPSTGSADWRELFGLTRRNLSNGFAFFQERTPVALPTGNSGKNLGLEACRSRCWTMLRDLLDYTADGAHDGVLLPSLFKSRNIVMPPSLARYALAFYLSSLVRYKPSQLDVQTHPVQAWAFDSFADESRLPLLQNALAGILGVPVFFYARDALRV